MVKVILPRRVFFSHAEHYSQDLVALKHWVDDACSTLRAILPSDPDLPINLAVIVGFLWDLCDRMESLSDYCQHLDWEQAMMTHSPDPSSKS